MVLGIYLGTVVILPEDFSWRIIKSVGMVEKIVSGVEEKSVFMAFFSSSSSMDGI